MSKTFKLRLAREKAVDIRRVARQYKLSGQFRTIDTNEVFSYGQKAGRP